MTSQPDFGRLSPTGLMGSLDWLGSLSNQGDSAAKKSCCAILYELEPVRLLLGDTLHPGGLALTHRLGKLVDIKPNDLVLDVACGRGTSAMAVARSFHCRVVGVDLGNSIEEATRLAKGNNVDGPVSFLKADGEQMPFGADSFDAALCECSMSLFPDKEQGVSEIARLLRVGGRLGVSDVTVEPGSLPEELKGALGQMLCLADAPSLDGYRRLFNADGLDLIHEQDGSDSVLKLLADIEGKLAAFRLFQRFQGTALSLAEGQSNDVPDLISQALAMVDRVRALVQEGAIGYWLFVAEKGMFKEESA